MRSPALVLAAVLLLPLAAWAGDAIAPDDPALLRKTNALCLAAALSSGGIDKRSTNYCSCMSPVIARHMTADSRQRLMTETSDYVRPAYDDPQAFYHDAMRTCPPQP